MNNQEEVIVGYCDLCRSYERASITDYKKRFNLR